MEVLRRARELGVELVDGFPGQQMYHDPCRCDRSLAIV